MEFPRGFNSERGNIAINTSVLSPPLQTVHSDIIYKVFVLFLSVLDKMAARLVFGDISNAANVAPTKSHCSDDAMATGFSKRPRLSSTEDGGFYSQENTPTVCNVSGNRFYFEHIIQALFICIYIKKKIYIYI